MKLLEFVNYAKKFFVALVAALAQLAVVLEDGHVTTTEWILVVIAFAGALGVYQVANKQV